MTQHGDRSKKIELVLAAEPHLKNNEVVDKLLQDNIEVTTSQVGAVRKKLFPSDTFNDVFLVKQFKDQYGDKVLLDTIELLNKLGGVNAFVYTTKVIDKIYKK